MASTKTVATSGNQKLAEFQTVVQQQEGIFGPLKEFGRDGQNNTITLEIGPKPANRALLEIYDSPPPPTKSGHLLVCTSECLVEGQEKKVAAYRRM
ncbi:MAG: hypothetical protein HY268_20625 [Deltaproteobacteria bacterium]|nr:hypothetical protein [Deltaproteobacteria bacterium]